MEEFCKHQEIYTSEQTKSIAKEFTRLDGQYYVDHAGATLYSEKQLEQIVCQLSSNLYANPHSSKLTEDAIDIVRYQILTHFKTSPEEYSVIFTSGATAALKLVAQNFCYGPNGKFVYLQDNHTSVVGMRACAQNSKCLKVDDAHNLLSTCNECLAEPDKSSNSLFVYPAQSNFSGVKYPLSWIKRAKNGHLNNFVGVNYQNWYVVLDAASYVSTNPLDLSLVKPDFVPVSLYKIFGYPMGLGALLVRNCSGEVLKKQYFGGGTVLMAQTLQDTVVLRDILHARFEDGTLPFLSIISIREGFNTLKRLNLNLEIISKHTFSLARYVYRNLLCLHHSNGRPAVVLYHPSTFEDSSAQGAIVNFNLLRDNGEHFGFSEVLHFAGLYNILLRTGCFCNPGGCQHFLKLSSDDVQRHFDAGHVCGDQHDLVNGYPTGSVRVSFGYMSTKIDADKVLEMIENCFVTRPILRQIPRKNDCNNKHIPYKNAILPNSTNFEEGTLEQIVLYPVKSCGGFQVLTKWAITQTGLKYDRQWMIINSSGVCFTQKNNRNMCLIRPQINLETGILSLAYPGHDNIEITIIPQSGTQNFGNFCESKVCGDKIEGWDCGNEVASWLSKVLNTPGLRLLKQRSGDVASRISKTKKQLTLSLANKAQYLIINKSSVRWLRDQITDEEFTESLQTTIKRFRPNFLVKFYNPFAENDYKEFVIEGLEFQAGGVCTRCQMICVDQDTGFASKEPLQSLSRAFKGKISFGVYLNRTKCNDDEFLYIGSKVLGIRRVNLAGSAT